MRVLASMRVLLARRPWIYWVLVAGLAAAAGMVAAGKLREVDEARRSWGESTSVWVATVDIAPGDAVVAERRLVPLAMIPAAVLDADPAALIALQRVAQGEILTSADVGEGAFALLPPGWHGVAFAADDTTIRVGLGDHVSVVGDGAVLVADGVVIDVAERSVTVGVPADDAPAAALAARAQTAALTLHRPDG